MFSASMRHGSSLRSLGQPSRASAVRAMFALSSGAKLSRSPRPLFSLSRMHPCSHSSPSLASISSLSGQRAAAGASITASDTDAEFQTSGQLRFEDHRVVYQHLRTEELLHTLLVLILCSMPLFVQHVDRLLHGSTAAASPDAAGAYRGSDVTGGCLTGSSNSSPTGASASVAQLASQWRLAVLDRGGASSSGWLRDVLFRHFCIGYAPSDVWCKMNRLRAHGVGVMLDYVEEDEAMASLPLRCTPAAAASAAATATAAGLAAAMATAHCRRQRPACGGRAASTTDGGASMLYDSNPFLYERLYGRHFRGFMAAIDTAATLPGQNFSPIKLSALADETASGGGRRGGSLELLVHVSVALDLVLAALRQRDAATNTNASAAIAAASGSGGGSRTVRDVDLDERLRHWGMVPPSPGDGVAIAAAPAPGAGGGKDVTGAEAPSPPDYEGWLRRQDLGHLVALAADLGEVPYPDDGNTDAAQPSCVVAAAAAAVAATTDANWSQGHARQQQLLRQLKLLQNRLEALVERAVSKGVKLIIDAELSPMRPALEHIAHSFMRKFNCETRTKRSVRADGGGDSGGGGGGGGIVQASNGAAGAAVAAVDGGAEALVFLTYQAYLTDTRQRLAEDLSRAERGGYTLGVNLVSGAYMHLERTWVSPPATTTATTAAVAAATALPPPPPAAAAVAAAVLPQVYDTVDGTHASFADCLHLLLDAIQAGRAEVMVGSHHRESVAAAVGGLAAWGLDPKTAPVYFGQLLGLADDVSFSLGAAGYKVYKLCPFGHPDRVVPYLARRVYETHYALQVATGRQELQLVQSELMRRFLYDTAVAAGAAATVAATKMAGGSGSPPLRWPRRRPRRRV